MASTEYPLAAIAEVIRDACLALGWSQRELSRRSGVPQTAISRILRGRLEDSRSTGRSKHADEAY